MKVQVLLPKIFDFPFTYYSNQIPLKIGDLVEVQFGKKNEISVVWKNNHSDLKDIKIKSINKKIKNYSIDKKLVDFIEWFSIYNIVPIGLVLKMTIGIKDNFTKKEDPKIDLIKKKVKKFRLNDEQKNALKY